MAALYALAQILSTEIAHDISLDSPKRLPLGCADVSISAGLGIYTSQGISICKR